ncbi:MAG: DUF4249 domain-containing protein [Hyphomicrobiales bacterium]
MKIYHLLFILLLVSCQKEVDFDFDQYEKKVVIEAALTNQTGPQWVRLSYLSRNFGTNASYVQVDDYIGNAVVKLSDDQGNEYTYTKYIDQSETFKGYYKFDNVNAQPNRTYTLNVTVDGKTYTARDYMNEVPVITNVKTERMESEIPGKQSFYVPLISFDNPSKQMYYLMSHQNPQYELMENTIGNNSRSWPFLIFDNQQLNREVRDLRVTDHSPEGTNFLTYSPGETVRVYLYSISKKAYDFYDALIRQYYNDGGAFQPSPASAPSNFNNGAIGFFRVSAASTKDKVVR